MARQAGGARAPSPGFGLCRMCLARVTVRGRRRPSNPRAAPPVGPPECFICGGLMDALDELADVAVERTAEYEYETFTVGATLKPAILDRDDYIRSSMSAAGAGSVKAALTGKLAGMISRKTSKRLDRDDPDLTILLDTRFGSCEVRSRHVVVYMRYSKTRRGVPQKRAACGTCEGAGCAECHLSGSGPSVEGMLTDYLLDVVGGTGVRFTWVGGEDRESLVMGGGRPVYARVCNPVRSARALPGSVSLDGIRVTEISRADKVPARLPPFSSVVRVVVWCGDAPNLRPLKTLAGRVRVDVGPGRPSSKRIGTVYYRRVAPDSVRIETEVEGGTPIKRLVDGEGVDPSVSSVLGVGCKCVRFDFLDVIAKG